MSKYENSSCVTLLVQLYLRTSCEKEAYVNSHHIVKDRCCVEYLLSYITLFIGLNI